MIGWWLLAGQAGFAYTNLDSAFRAMGFDPRAPGNAVVVFFSDVHMTLQPGIFQAFDSIITNLDYRLVEAVNRMDPPPAKIISAGDVSSSMSVVPGGDATRDPVGYRWATNEMTLWREGIKAFTNIHQTNIVWIPGNHDQGGFYETNAETFRMMFPEMPTCQTFDLAGTRFILMNSGNYGQPTDEEKAWLRQLVASTSPTQEVAIVTHQPPFHGQIVHRGLVQLLRELFSDWQVRWWVLDGHEHSRSLEVYNVGRSNVAQFTVGPASTNTFMGYTFDCGSAFLCLSNGIVGHVYFHYWNNDYEVATQPNWAWPRRFIGAFEDTPNLLWRRLKSSRPAPEVVYAKAMDSRDWYGYPKELQWAIPLSNHANQATHFVLLITGLTPTSLFDFSSDRTNWVQMSIPPVGTNYAHWLPIPPDLSGLPTIYARFRSFDGNNWVAGWGLASTNAGPLTTFPQLGHVPDQQVMAGRLLSFPLPVIDPYAPPDRLRFTLLHGPPGATVDESSGLFRWRLAFSNPAEVVPIIVKVTDDYLPSMGATQQFSIAVSAAPAPIVSLPEFDAQRISFSVWAQPGYTYRVFFSTNLPNWELLWTTNTTVDSFVVEDTNAVAFPQRFYRVEAQE